MAEELDVSRSNVYSTRERVARKLGIDPNEVAESGPPVRPRELGG